MININKIENKGQTDSETSHQLQVSTRFMETFEIVRPIKPGSDFGLFLNDEGNLDIYSVGTENYVYRIRQNSNSNAPWTQTELGFKAGMLSIYEGKSGKNNPDVMGVNEEGKLTLSVYDSENKTYRQQVSQPVQAVKKIIRFLAAKKYENVYANVILEDNTVCSSFMKSDGTWASRDWVPIKESSGSSADAKAYQIAMCHNNPVQNALYAIGTDKSVLFSDSSSRFSYFTCLSGLKAVDISVIQDVDKRLNIFAVSDKDRGVYVKREKKYSSTGKIEWEPWTLVSNVTKIRNIRTAINSTGIIEVFGIQDDSRGTLYISRETKNEKGDRTGWTELFPLSNPVPNSQFEVAQNAQGYSEAYTVSQYNTAQGINSMHYPQNAGEGEAAYMYRFCQSPQTTQWFSMPVMIEEAAKMVPVPTHSVELAVLYPNGAAYPFADVRLNTSVTSTIRINGLAYIASPLQQVSAKADAAGMVSFNYSTTSLASPTFFINTADMQGGEGVTIEPNLMLQAKMHNITTDEILNARGAEGQLLVQGSAEEREKNAEAVKSVMQNAASIGMTQLNSSDPRLCYLKTNRNTNGLRYHTRGAQDSCYKLDMSDVSEQHWRVIFDDNGGLLFEALDAEGAGMYISNLCSVNASGSFLGIEWGDLWNSIKQGAGVLWEGLKQIIVTTIINPVTKLVETIKVVAEFVIDGITKVFESVVKAFQQAFDVIEGIWAKLKVFFKDLYAWLAFFFNLEDISRTADAVKHTINAALDFTVIGVRAVKEQVSQALDGISDELKKAVDEFIGKMPGEGSIGEYCAAFEDPAGKEVYKDGSSHNVMLNAYKENYINAEPAQTSCLIQKEVNFSSKEKIEELVDMLVSLADNFEYGDGKQAFDEAVAYFTAIGQHPDQALNLVVKGAIKMMEASMLFVLDTAKGIILSIFDIVADIVILVRELLNEEWKIPFVSDLYEFFSGKSLTFSAMDLLSYIIAIPGTLIFKITENKAPFPTDEALQEFEKVFTAEWLAEQSGIAAKSKVCVMASNADITPQAVIGPIFKVFGGTIYFVRIITETMNIAATAAAKLSEQPDLPFSSRTIGVANLICAFGSSAFSTPWALKENAGGLSCGDTNGLGNIIWLCNLICGPGRSGVLLGINIISKKELPTEVGDLTATLWGCVHIGMQIWYICRKKDLSDSLKARAIMSPMGSQLFRFALVGPLVVSTYGITALALEILVLATNTADGIITLQTV
ncbi:hypothetical protein [Ruminiclostridium sufflavum]|nr:hypothetical protein [Ruminiclostridium sufflavum]